MAKLDKEAILQALRSVLIDDGNQVSLHEPFFSGNEWNYVKKCIDTRWVSSAGEYVEEFERKLEDFTGVKHAVATVNGTSALHISCLLAEVQPQDEVLMPTLTFVATPNAVSYCGAVPHFIDIEEKTLGVDVDKLEAHLNDISEISNGECVNRLTGQRIKAVICMHAFGHPVDLDPLLELCGKFNLTLIEDAAESLGSYYKDRHTGNWGLLTAVSFNGNKIVTTGGGGCILTNNTELARVAKHLTTTAKIPHKWIIRHDRIAFNYRMPNINAALGCAQLEQLPNFIEAKRALAETYRKAFHAVEGVRFFSEVPYAKSNYWLNVLILDPQHADERDALLDMTNACGIVTRPAWELMHFLPMYAACPKMALDAAENIYARLINVPSSVFLSKSHMVARRN